MTSPCRWRVLRPESTPVPRRGPSTQESGSALPSVTEGGRCYLGVRKKPRKLLAWPLGTNCERGYRSLRRDAPPFRRAATPIVGRRRHGCQTGPADLAFRLPRGVGGLPGRPACDLRGAVGQDRQEGFRRRERDLRSSRRGRPLLRLDRRPDARIRRVLLSATVHAAQDQEQMVEGQPQEG